MDFDVVQYLLAIWNVHSTAEDMLADGVAQSLNLDPVG
jgi:hypothetical protein